MTTPRPRESRAARDASTRFEAKATSTNDKLLRLFRRTLKDQTPQQRRLLAGDIALVIPREGTTERKPELLWMQRLRAFATRELELDQVPQRSRGPAAGSGRGQEFDAWTAEAIEIDRVQRVPVAKGGRPSLSVDRAHRLLLGAMTRFRQKHDVTERVTNIALSEAVGVSPDTISNWLALSEWTLEDLDVEWSHRSRARLEHPTVP